MTRHLRGGLTSAVLAVPALVLSLTGAGASAAPVTSSQPTRLATQSPDISVTDTMARLQRLQDIATANSGNRGTGKPGYLASVNYAKAELDAAGYTTTVQSFSTIYGTSYNLIADLPGGDTSNIVMAGGHLDSVRTGPGINDNGSGSAGLLETAVTLAESDATPTKHVRFAFWGAEEQGLLGSDYYVGHLTAAQLGAIDVYLNFDMIGSPNYGVFVYDDNPAGNAVRDELTSYFTGKGTPWEYIDPDGRSDHASFRAEGIPTAGLYSGGEETKTAAQAGKWGGTAGQDVRRRATTSACDTINNISQASVDIGIDAIGHMVWQQAGVTSDPGPGAPVVANPGNKTATVGTAVAPVTLSASGGTAPYGFSASGLPTGLSLSGSTISGTPTAAGTFTVTVTATDAASRTGSAQFTWTVNPASGNLLKNAGFESGAVDWTGTEWRGDQQHRAAGPDRVVEGVAGWQRSHQHGDDQPAGGDPEHGRDGDAVLLRADRHRRVREHHLRPTAGADRLRDHHDDAGDVLQRQRQHGLRPEDARRERVQGQDGHGPVQRDRGLLVADELRRRRHVPHGRLTGIRGRPGSAD